MGDMGLLGSTIPEEYGGSNFGITGISVILGECAKTLTPSPLFATGVLGAFSITNFGSSEQKQNYLPKIASGELTTALAIDESSHHNPANTEMVAKKDGKKFVLKNKPFNHLPRSLWKALLLSEAIDSNLKWADLSKYEKESLVKCLTMKMYY